MNKWMEEDSVPFLHFDVNSRSWRIKVTNSVVRLVIRLRKNISRIFQGDRICLPIGMHVWKQRALVCAGNKSQAAVIAWISVLWVINLLKYTDWQSALQSTQYRWNQLVERENTADLDASDDGNSSRLCTNISSIFLQYNFTSIERFIDEYSVHCDEIRLRSSDKVF